MCCALVISNWCLRNRERGSHLAGVVAQMVERRIVNHEPQTMTHEQIKLAPWRSAVVAPQPAPQIEYAGFGIRLEAALIDYMLCLGGSVILVWVASLLARYMSLTALLMAAALGFTLVFFFNHMGLGTVTRQTIGKWIVGIEVISADGRPLTLARLLARCTIGYAISLAPLGLGFIRVLWDPDRQGWHDVMFATYVVRMK